MQEKSKANNYLLVIIANARYYAQLLRNRPVESDSTGNRTYYETLKISLVLEPSSPEQSARVDTLVVDSATRPFIPRATLPLDRSTARSSPFASKRPVASFVRVRRLFTTKRYISFPQTIDIFFPHKGTIYLFLIFSRASRFFGGPRRLVHRRSSSFPSRGRTRARTRRRDGSFDEKSILSSKVKKQKLNCIFRGVFCSYFLQNACVFSVVFSLSRLFQKDFYARLAGADFAGSAPFCTPHRASKRQSSSMVPQWYHNRARSTHSLLLLF